MLDKRQIEDNTKWLLTNGSLPVKYLTYRDLLREDVHSKTMKKLFGEIEKSDLVEEIFSKQEADGSWCTSGSWSLPPSYEKKSGHTPVSPKYVTTAWILPILGDMGFTIQDTRIRKACEYMLSYQSKNGFIAESHTARYNVPYKQLPIEPCRFILMLIALGKVGAEGDPRVKEAYNLLIKWQREDGGWVSNSHYNQKNWSRSCPYATYHGAMALYSSHNKLYEESLVMALEFLVEHLSSKDDDALQRFYYHGHSIIHELLMLTERNIGLTEKAIQTILHWIMTLYHPKENYFRYEGKAISKYSYKRDYMVARVAKYRLFHLIEDDWLTYYLTKIMSNIEKCDNM